MLSLPPLSLYIHIPWCVKKCPYCDFNSHQKNGELPEKEYIAALLEDLRHDLVYIQNRPLHSIFIGGGTPSLFSASSFHRLLQEIENLVPFKSNIEITLEANPGTFEQQKFSDFRHAGLNRLSIGIQSFQDKFLQSLDRIHNDKEALGAAAIATKAGFDNFNLDLMFGLPGQSQDQALKDLEIAVECNPSHLSWYQLTIEPNTAFYSAPPTLPHEDKIIDMHDAGKQFLMKHHYYQYEISAYSQPNKQSNHNLNYWQFGDYLGIGAGAHGKITLLNEQHVIRTRKTRQPKHYLDKSRKFNAPNTRVSPAELPLEFMMNAMRLCAGCEIATFEQRTGISINTIEKEIVRLKELDLLEGCQLKPTPKGQQFLNDLLAEFL